MLASSPDGADDMTNWARGGPTWSINRFVAREVRGQMRENPLARRARYRWPLRLLRRLFSVRTFWRFIALYLLVDLAAVGIEVAWQWLTPGVYPDWASGPGANELLKDVPGFLIGAQVSLVGVISLALALVTLIAQRDDASTDVQVYYHESLFFEITASCLALVAILCIQLLWPLQFTLHLARAGGQTTLFKLGLLVFHLGWFLLNLTAVAHFVSVTFRFVQRRAREKLRESYTANVVVPEEMTQRLRVALYHMAGTEAVPVEDDTINPVAFGLEMGRYEAELRSTFSRPTRVRDLHVRLAHWAITRWRCRCAKHEGTTYGVGPDDSGPKLWFTPRVDRPLQGEVAWCRREGGLPLDWRERLALRLAFRFEKARDEE